MDAKIREYQASNIPLGRFAEVIVVICGCCLLISFS